MTNCSEKSIWKWPTTKQSTVNLLTKLHFNTAGLSSTCENFEFLTAAQSQMTMQKKQKSHSKSVTNKKCAKEQKFSIVQISLCKVCQNWPKHQVWVVFWWHQDILCLDPILTLLQCDFTCVSKQINYAKLCTILYNKFRMAFWLSKFSFFNKQKWNCQWVKPSLFSNSVLLFQCSFRIVAATSDIAHILFSLSTENVMHLNPFACFC